MNLNDVPQPLYKYRQWHEPHVEKQYQKKVLTDSEIYLSAASQFNDPFDCAIPFRFNKAELTPENLFLAVRNVLKKSEPQLSSQELRKQTLDKINTGIFKTNEYWENVYDKDIEFYNTFGILSLTSIMDNIVMWSHYADSHRGFCVGFDKYILREVLGGTLDSVKYKIEMPFVNLFTEGIDDLNNLLLTKYIDWKYEGEYRLIKNFSARRAYTLPNEAILEVYLGAKMPEETKKIIIELVSKKFKKAKIFQSKLILERFELLMTPIVM